MVLKNTLYHPSKYVFNASKIFLDTERKPFFFLPHFFPDPRYFFYIKIKFLVARKKKFCLTTQRIVFLALEIISMGNTSFM